MVSSAPSPHWRSPRDSAWYRQLRPVARTNPARISFDLPNTTLAMPSKRVDVHASGVDTIVAAETKDRTRLVVNLDKLVPYDTRVSGNNIVVMLGGASASTATVAPAASTTPISNV